MLNVGDRPSTRLFTPIIASLCPTPVTIEGAVWLLWRPDAHDVRSCPAAGREGCATTRRLPDRGLRPDSGRKGRSRRIGFIAVHHGLVARHAAGRAYTILHVDGAVSTPYLDMTPITQRVSGIEISQRDYEEFIFPDGMLPLDLFQHRGRLERRGDKQLVAGATAAERSPCATSRCFQQAGIDGPLHRIARAGAAVINEEESVTKAALLPAPSNRRDELPHLFPALAALAAADDGVRVIRGNLCAPEYKECKPCGRHPVTNTPAWASPRSLTLGGEDR